MRHYALTALAACTAALIGGQAQAQQPGPPATVPDQMPFNIPYGISITADRAAEVAKVVMAEARKGARDWKLAITVVDTHGELVYFYKMDDTQQASDDLAEQGAHRSALSSSDANLQQRYADPGRCIYRDT